MYDIIGDIHGHADELVQLLGILGYRQKGNCYAHPERQVIFVGDFVDRGPKIRLLLQIVRPMVEQGTALAVLGNHEFNALAYHTENPQKPGEYLRPHSAKNEHQHRQTLEQLNPAELQSSLDWFRTLPAWLELDGLRVIHACWDELAMKQIEQGFARHGRFTAPFLQAACNEKDPLFAAIEIVLKGREAALPAGLSFRDKEGHLRTEFRTRWYLSPHGHTYRTYVLQSDEIASDMPLSATIVSQAKPYPREARPLFLGHYWLAADCPELLAENVACVDYSVARGGFLCAYRWQGEKRLVNEHFVRCNL